jgi:hypothetical protein
MPTSMIKTEVIYYFKKTLRPARLERPERGTTRAPLHRLLTDGKVIQCCMFQI